MRQFTGDTSRFSHIGLPDLSRTHLAYVTYGPGRYGFGGQNLRLQTLTGPSRVVYRATSGGANAANIVSPSFDVAGTHLYWARTNNGSGTGNRYLRLTLATGRQDAARGSSRICSTSWASDADGFATGIALPGCRARRPRPAPGSSSSSRGRSPSASRRRGRARGSRRGRSRGGCCRGGAGSRTPRRP